MNDTTETKPEAPPTAPRWHALAVGLLGLAITVGFCWWGIDIGRHPDTVFHVRPLRALLFDGALLPGFYSYPSMSYVVGLISMIPFVVRELAGGTPLDQLAERLLEVTKEPVFVNNLRRTFSFVCALTAIPLAFLCRATGKTIWTTAAAVLLFATSWEVIYHLRFVAPDGLAMLFSLAAILLSVVALNRPEQRRWLRLAALAAGGAFASKYPLGLAILPPLTALFLLRKQEGPRVLAREAALLGLILVVTFLVITPGAIFQQHTFIQDIRYEMQHYSERGHRDYTVTRGPEHLYRVGRYFVAHAAWPILPLSVVIFLLAVVGMVAEVRTNRQRALVLLIFPTVYLLYFSTQRVFFPRNYLAVTPLFYFFVASGAETLWRYTRGRRPWAGWFAGAAITMVVFINLGTNAFFSSTILDRGNDDAYRAAMRSWIEGRDDLVLLTPRAQSFLLEDGKDVPPNTTLDRDAEWDYFIRNTRVHPARVLFDAVEWDTTAPYLATRWFGPYELNYNYYPTSIGDARWVVIRRAAAQRYDINFDDRILSDEEANALASEEY